MAGVVSVCPSFEADWPADRRSGWVWWAVLTWESEAVLGGEHALVDSRGVGGRGRGRVDGG